MRVLSAVISIQDGYSPLSLTHSSHEHPNLRILKETLWILNLLDCEHEEREREKRGGPAVGWSDSLWLGWVPGCVLPSF